MRVLLVEDDLVAVRGLSLMLKVHNAIIDHADAGEEAVDLARRYDYDVVLIDPALPDMDGYEVLRRLRAARIEVPVVVLSGEARPEARVRALGMGADDFLVKPFDRAELLARMRAVIRRSKGFSHPCLRIGAVALHMDNRSVTVADRPVNLTGKEYQVLELMALRKGLVLTKEAFLNHLYGGMDEPEMKIIDVFVCKLRKKLAAAGAPGLIATAWGRGYMLQEPRPHRPRRAADTMPEGMEAAGTEATAEATTDSVAA